MVSGNLLSQLLRRGHQLIKWYYATHESNFFGLGRADNLSGKGHFKRFCTPYKAWQIPGPTISRNDAHIHEYFAKLGRIRCDSDVTHHGEITACPNGVTVDCGNNGDLDLIQRQWDTLNTFAVPVAGSNGMLLILLGIDRELFNIAA